MNIGPRTIKTGLAVALTLLITNLFNFDFEIIAVIASVLAMQPSIMRSINYIKEVFISNSIGIAFAIVGTILLGNDPVAIAAIVIIAISINLKLSLDKTINLTVLTIIAIMVAGGDGLNFIYILERIALIATGILSAFIINVFIFPPDHQKLLFAMIKETSEKTNFMLRALANRTMTIPKINEEERIIETKISKIKEHFNVLSDERKNMFIKDNKINFLRNIVIYKNMIDMLEKQLLLIRELKKNEAEIEEMSNKKTLLIQKLLKEINMYSENIMLMSENKIVLNKNLQKETKSAMKVTINNLIEELQGSKIEKWIHIFPIANSIIELFAVLDKLEKMVRINQMKMKTNKR